MTVLETSQLAELIAGKHQCLLELRDMSTRQRKCIEDGQISDLIKVLGAKQILINRLGQIERTIDPFRTEDPDSREWRSPEDRAECRRIVKECDAILSEIIEGERESETILRDLRDETARQLQGSHASDVARQGYAEAQPRTVSHIDIME